MLKGHVRGHSDGLIYINNEWQVLELKTSNHKDFLALKRSQSVMVTKPQHYCQMNLYMQYHHLTKAMYMVVDKDTDALYYEIVEKDENIIQDMMERAIELVTINHPPHGLSEDITFWKCSYCNFKNICHSITPPRKTCRMCKSVKLIDDGGWKCKKTKIKLSVSKQLQGCHRFESII